MKQEGMLVDGEEIQAEAELLNAPTLSTKDEPAQLEDFGEVVLGVPLKQIPALPWTAIALGFEKYCALCRFAGYGEPQASFMPDLDPRTFAHGVAYKRIEKLLSISVTDANAVNKRRGLITKILDGREDSKKYCISDDAYVEVQWVLGQRQRLQEHMDTLCGEPAGTPYSKAAIEANQAVAKKLIKR